MKLKVHSGKVENEVEIDRISATEFLVGLNGRFRRVELLAREGEQLVLSLCGRVEHLVVSGRDANRTVAWRDRVLEFQIQDPRRLGKGSSAALSGQGIAQVKAQMPGKVVAVLKNAGDDVEVGEGLVIVESMKMQNQLKSPKAGTITLCNVAVDSSIEGGQLLFQID